jgi:TctA family transporter
LGFVLGKIAENNFYIATIRYGAAWLSRPVVLVLVILTLVVIIHPFLHFRQKKAQVEKAVT